MEAHTRTQTGPRTLGKRMGANIGASRKPLFRSTFRFAWSSLAFPPDEAWGGPRRR